MGLGVCLVLALIVGTIANSGVMGMGAFIIFAVVMYMYLISFQAKHDEKERDQMIAAIGLPDIIHVKPIPVYQMFRFHFKLRT